MKHLIKKFIPRRLFCILKSLANWAWAIKAYRYDRRRFMNYSGYGGRSGSQDSTEAHVIFYTHQIEKGLSHVEFRDGFGKQALKNLRLSMSRLTNHESTVYIAALSAIKAYLEVHDSRQYDTSEIKAILGESLTSEASKCSSRMSGYHIIHKSSKLDNKNKNFKELFENRYTVREFSDEPVDIAKIYEAVAIATKTPSVCNRQSFRIVVIKDREIIKQLLQIQNGFRGYSFPPVMALVLTDAQSFRDVSERNYQYIDGGSFMMSFLLGLEYAGLAACPLNTMFSITEEKRTRKILNLTDNYNFISFVAIGNFMDQNKVANSFRFPADEIIIEV